jgi:hypothetical protein
MTYTFKLARRLAVSRTLGMLPALLLFAACSGDTTAPENSANPLTPGSTSDPRFRRTVPVTVSINPRSVTVETNQLIRFFAQGTTAVGDTVEAAVRWTATGGTILSDGRFSSAATGSFMVLAISGERDKERIDTAVVQVVRRQPLLKSISISPATSTLTPGLSQTFLATGTLRDGRLVPVGIRWTATGGTIDAGGTYTAGDTAGTYQVIGTNTHLLISDTAVVTIGAPAPPPPPPASEPPDSEPPPSEPAPAPPPPAAPVLVQVTLVPATATLAPSTTRRFAAYARLEGGDSIAVDTVVAAGGTITRDASDRIYWTYKAGTSAGTYRVVSRAGSLADTSSVTVSSPLGSGPSTGVPYGTFNLFSSTTTVQPGPFSLSHTWDEPDGIVSRITAARNMGVKLMLVMTGGHSGYLKPGATTSGTQFDIVKWKARMDLFNTTAIRQAIAAGVQDGTIIGASVMDEPNHRDWGGVVTKATLDEMARYVKGYFPSLPVGVVIVHWWRSTERYQDIDFIVDQYDWWQSPNGPGGGQSGNVAGWRDAALAMAAANGISIAFSMNILNGGIQDLSSADRLEAWRCPTDITGGRGTRTPACRMHANNVRDWGSLLGVSGCALLMWRYEDAFMTRLDNQSAFKDVANKLVTTPGKSCKRP